MREPLNQEQTELAEQLRKELNLSPPLSQLLFQRGITTFDEAKHFFRPALSDLHDPFLMKDMDAAVRRIEKAISLEEKILVYGDYDVDGSTSVALFYDFFSRFHSHIDYYIPDRYTEGYGVSWQAIDWAEKNNIDLIVTLDCGIKSVDKITEAAKRGIDVIVCDHHRPGDDLPPAVAVLDPKRNDCLYPYKELTGCGIGFKLVQAYCLANNLPTETALSYLDLVMISTAADIVPITGENRILAFHGLIRLNSQPRPGVKALMDVAGLTSEVNITNVVFGLAPRINAAGRIKHAKEAVRLLLCERTEDAADFATEINDYNLDRRNFDSTITDEALSMIAGDEWMQKAHSTVLYREDWHKGVIGIVASRCIEHFHRPTIIFTHSNGKAAGSARSVPGFDLYEAIEECADLLEQFGGHTFAAGMTLPLENIPAFRLRFEEVVQKKITKEQLTPQLEVDLPIDLSDITPKFYNILRQMAPFGPGNMTPVFVTRGLKLHRPPFIMKEKHLKLEVTQDGRNVFTAVAFGAVEHLKSLQSGMPFSLCYTLEENVFRNTRSLQLMVKDIQFEASSS
jgi:single-stranded-DNA-specific exonuclease